MHERDKGASEVGQLASAAVDDGSRRDDDTSVLANDFDGLGHAPAARDDVLGDDELLPLANFKASPQDKSALAVLFHEDVVATEVSSDFLTHDDAAHGR